VAPVFSGDWSPFVFGQGGDFAELKKRSRERPEQSTSSAVYAAWIKARFVCKRFDMINKIEIERFSIISSKPFDQVVAALDAAIGHPDMSEFARSTREAHSFAELKSAVEKGLSTAGLMLFMQLDHGAVLRKETGRDTPRMIRFIIGNPLIMKEMAKHVPDAGSYAPVTVLVDERADGVHLSYDKMASFLAPYANAAAMEVARELDRKVEGILQQAAV